ncbi:MAG: hypothetical protein R3F24_14740 [Gammaproteobacteria bacterium]
MLLHAWELKGELRHPRGEIESFEAKVGPYTHTFAYPVGVGEGLLVYAWQDTDGDVGFLHADAPRSYGRAGRGAGFSG